MTFLDCAIYLADKGFHVFPLMPGSKLPAISHFPEEATRSHDKIRAWWTDGILERLQPYNIGISTTHFGGDGEALVVVDVDNKGKKQGSLRLKELDIIGFDMPTTYKQETPTGGFHFVYKNDHAVKQGVDVLARGLDIRSWHGYIVGAGSVIDGKSYKLIDNPVVTVPTWIAIKTYKPDVKEEKSEGDVLSGIDQARARKRAIGFLETADPAVEGEGGDFHTFTTICMVKDFGVQRADCLELLLSYWNDRCSPPWTATNLGQKCDNAYHYGTKMVGESAPESDFNTAPPVLDKPSHPFKTLNKEYAFVIAGGGGHILWETKGPRDEAKTEHLMIPTFHQKLAAYKMETGDGKKVSISKRWMESSDRRSYDGICFMPGKEAPKKFYNLWKGFAVQPATRDTVLGTTARDSLAAFLEHTAENICDGNKKLHEWLLGYFAHLVQKPHEKPPVALVFRGAKGVGKNVVIETIGYLLGSHFLLTSSRRYLTGNFNGHLENCLLFVLDEAFWSGDKQAEGILKDLITGKKHLIERKGYEPFTVDNCTRIAVIGNEQWIVPATQDERRYAVFNVGNKRKQDLKFFKEMREGMEAGGYRLLLQFLLDYSLKGINVFYAPKTKGLLDQKIASLEPLAQWWLECISEGIIMCADFEGFPSRIDKKRLRDAFGRYLKERQIRSRSPSFIAFGKGLKEFCPDLKSSKRREGNDLMGVYVLPGVEECRVFWERHIGQDMVWE